SPFGRPLELLDSLTDVCRIASEAQDPTHGGRAAPDEVLREARGEVSVPEVRVRGQKFLRPFRGPARRSQSRDVSVLDERPVVRLQPVDESECEEGVRIPRLLREA